jgi:osmotically-inducible protein OsmY
MTQRYLTLTAVGMLAASMALAGCNRREQQDARDATQDAVTRTEQTARNLGSEASRSMDKAKEATREMAQDAKDATKSASSKIGDKVEDAVITTSVKAELAKASDLSALKINVDTANGNVALHGTAPTSAAREHATTLAQGVKGVVSVDNQLSVDGK